MQFNYFFPGQKEMPKTKEQTRENVFWMIYGEGKAAPTRKHFNVVDAQKEAERLATVNGGKYYVLQMVGSATATVNIGWKFPLPPKMSF